MTWVNDALVLGGAALHRLRKKSVLHLLLGGAAPGSPDRALFAGWGGGLQRCDAGCLSRGFSRWGRRFPSRGAGEA